MNTIIVRPEEEPDWPSVKAVNSAAFETSAEATLVDSLRARADPTISLVAELNNSIVGHILFNPVKISEHPDIDLMALAPMAVDPQWQRRGIGSRLINAGLASCRDLGCGAVVVLGHPQYYTRFGFRSSKEFGIESEFNVPAEVFMLIELIPDYLYNVSGVVQYHEAFSDL